MLNDPTELLMLLEKSTVEIQLKESKKGWDWRNGVQFFITPESRCCFCGEVFETNRVYLIDNVNQKVPKQWRLETGKAIRKGNKMYHPHAFHEDGAVCLNNANTLVQLLFNSVNPSPNYYAQAYFWDVGHACPKFPKGTCSQCKKEVPIFALVYGVENKKLCSETCVKEAMGKNEI